MIYQENIFTKEECDRIINYKNKYESIIVTDPDSLIDNTRTVYHKEENYTPYFKFLGKTYENGIDEETGNQWVKKYNVWDIPTNDETMWFYDKIYDWFINVSGVPLDKKISADMAHKLHEYVVGDNITHFPLFNVSSTSLSFDIMMILSQSSSFNFFIELDTDS